MLPIDADKAEEINRDMGTFSMIIPAGTYSFQKEDCPTVSTRLLLVTSADQPDRIVTDMLTAMLENVEYLRSVHANLRGLSAESMAGYAGIPMHPAAERFFRRHAISKN